MTILSRNRAYMFTVFTRGDEYLITVVAGGVAMYEITIRLSEQDLRYFAEDETGRSRLPGMSRPGRTRTGTGS